MYFPNWASLCVFQVFFKLFPSKWKLGWRQEDNCLCNENVEDMLLEYVVSSCTGENGPNHEVKFYLLPGTWNFASTVIKLIPVKTWLNLKFSLKTKKKKKKKVAQWSTDVSERHNQDLYLTILKLTFR